MSSNLDFLNRRMRVPRSGAAVVELAAVLPLIVMLLIGTIEACSMIHLSQSLHIAAYEAARNGLIPKSTEVNVRDAANKILSTRNTKDTSIMISPNNFPDTPIGTTITVTVSAPSSSNVPFRGMFFSGRTVSASCSMMKEY